MCLCTIPFPILLPSPFPFFKYISFISRRCPSTFPFSFRRRCPRIFIFFIFNAFILFLLGYGYLGPSLQVFPVVKCCEDWFLWTVLSLVDLIFFVLIEKEMDNTTKTVLLNGISCYEVCKSHRTYLKSNQHILQVGKH